MRKKILVRVIFLSSFALMLTVILRKIFSVDFVQVQAAVASFGIYAPVVYGFIFFLGLTVPFNPISDFLVVNAAVLLFPAYESVIATFISHCFVLVTNYWMARKYGDVILRHLAVRKEADYIEKLIKKLTPGGIFALRFVLPTAHAVGMDLVSYAAGIEKISFGKFFIASIIPWTILNVVYFYSSSYLKQQAFILYALPSVLLIAVPTIVLFLKRRIH